MFGDCRTAESCSTEAHPERCERSSCETLDLSDEGDGSADATGVGGVEYPMRGPLLLVGEDGVPELSFAPSQLVFRVLGTGELRK